MEAKFCAVSRQKKPGDFFELVGCDGDVHGLALLGQMSKNSSLGVFCMRSRDIMLLNAS